MTSVHINVFVSPDDFEQARQSAEDIAEAVKATVSKSYPDAEVHVNLSTGEYFGSAEK